MIGGIEDLKGKWRARFYGKEKTAADIAAALPLWREEVPSWLGFLETVKATHGGQWMVGDRITLADFYAFEALDGAMRTDPTILAEHPGDPDSFARFRPYLAHFSPVFSRFLRVFTVSTRRLQRAPNRIPGPRDSDKGAQTPFWRPS